MHSPGTIMPTSAQSSVSHTNKIARSTTQDPPLSNLPSNHSSTIHSPDLLQFQYSQLRLTSTTGGRIQSCDPTRKASFLHASDNLFYLLSVFGDEELCSQRRRQLC
uniref:Uncharacterized protein n=1 Tax=Knipowitschia caucasica TaxID=637954 RepID=A0AAV2JSX9_KNICA